MTKSSIVLVAILGLIAVTGCRKEKLLEFPAPLTGGNGSGGSSFTPVTGTTWTDINPDPTDRINTLATVDNKLFVSKLWFGGINALYNGSTFSYCNQTIATFGSGSGLEKMQQSSNGEWFATGSMGAYGVYSYDVSDPGYPWDAPTTLFTNANSAVKVDGVLYTGCSIAPYIRALGSQVGNDLDGNVSDLIEFNGELIAGGNFANSGPTSVNNIAKWNGIEWLPLGTGLDGTVVDLELYDGKLIAVGSFNQNGDGNVNCSRVAVWDGSTWEPLGTGLTGGSNSARKALANGDELFIGGSFDSGGGVLSPNVIKWTGTDYESVAGGAPAFIGEMAIYDGKLYVANQFIIANSNFLLRLD